jgi:hypothetical protein
MQRESTRASSGAEERLSGLWHQRHRAGQPLRKTVVRIPGPSCRQKRWRLKMVPDGTDHRSRTDRVEGGERSAWGVI